MALEPANLEVPPRNWASIVYGFLIKNFGPGIIPDVPRLRDKLPQAERGV